ncbi:DUF2971 domain-containing protein [uncultured Flavonifractor sp.]|uniref:DUF2971 domain-containing protein n=1 Tax=Flavonifractor sp. An4 TaxID=1965634 RepID=UPI000B38E451|nr:DUF2971 domain-containing protein [Flavonifractor sp. An4]OUO07773.1 hypothetical protein B5F94_15670 [Flavonifractor sp. An4]
MGSLLHEFLMSLSVDASPRYTNFDGEIYHYTALHNIESILLNSRDKIVLWASQYDCLNDISEGTIVEPCYYKVCKDLRACGYISPNLYELLSGIKPSKNDFFAMRENNKLISERSEYTTYIASFSQKSDLLPMWNYYSKGDLFEGINLGMDSKAILSNYPTLSAHGKVRLNVSSVVYSQKEQEDIIKKFLLEIISKYKEGFEQPVREVVSKKLASLKMIFKQECFSYEQEVRIIVDMADKYRDDFSIKYRTNAGYFIPYIELLIDKKALKSVTLGPFRGTESQLDLQKKTLSQMLASHQYEININVSKVPIRY